MYMGLATREGVAKNGDVDAMTRLLGGADLQGFVTHRLAIARVAARLVARVARAYGARHLGSSTWASRCGVVQLSSAKSMMQKVV